MLNKNKRGFTIVELLIVIVVIAILAAISVVAYNGIQQRGRDSARISVMNQIKKSLELYKAINNTYPSCGNGSNACVSTTNPNGWGTFQGLAAYDGSNGLPDLKDPRNTTGQWGYYYAVGFKKSSANAYTSTGSSQDYIIATRLENSSTPAFNGWDNSSLNYLDGS